MENSDTRYLETMRYPNMLAMCINNINFAQQKGFTGFNECITLFSTMKTNILGDTKKDILKIVEDLQKEEIKVCKDVENFVKYNAKYKWSNKHISYEKNIRMQPIIRMAVHKMKTILIDQIDNKKLLISTEKNIPQGTEEIYK